MLCCDLLVFFINFKYIQQNPLIRSVNFLKSWPSTGYFSNSTGSSVTSGRSVLPVHWAISGTGVGFILTEDTIRASLSVLLLSVHKLGHDVAGYANHQPSPMSPSHSAADPLSLWRHLMTASTIALLYYRRVRSGSTLWASKARLYSGLKRDLHQYGYNMWQNHTIFYVLRNQTPYGFVLERVRAKEREREREPWTGCASWRLERTFGRSIYWELWPSLFLWRSEVVPNHNTSNLKHVDSVLF